MYNQNPAITSHTMRLTFLIIILLNVCFLKGQNDIGIGEWDSFLPHNQASKVTQSDDKIIYATNEAIFTIDKSDFSINYLSKVDGLTDTGVSELAYDSFNDQLVIAYDNGVIDLVTGQDVFPVFDIKNNTNFIDRRINKMYVQNEEWLYIATGFGLLQYNLLDLGFGFTLDAGQLISDVTGNVNRLAILGDQGVYVLDYANEIFPNAFSNWQLVSNGLPDDEEPKAILIQNDKLYVATDDAIYTSSDYQSFSLLMTKNDGYESLFMKPTQEGWMLGTKESNGGSKLLLFDETDALIQEINSCTQRLLDAEIDETGRIFLADEFTSIRYIDENGSCRREMFEGPFNVDASDINVKDGVLYIASGGITENFGNEFGRTGVYLLQDGEWNNIHQDNNSFFKDNDVIQFYQIEPHPSEDKFYIGSFWAGLVEYNEETKDQILYTAINTNGALGSSVGDEQRTKISGLAFDNDDNLWIASYLASKPLVVLTNEGTWHSFSINADTKLTDIVVDDLGYIWGVIGGNAGGVVVYDSNQTISDPTDDPPSKLLNLNNSEIPSNLVNSIAKDREGTIWVGTAQGVVAFECGGSVFESTCIGNRRRVLQDSIGAYLLETEDVQAIAIDGANRKWFGTRNGIFVQSPSGEEQIAKFDVDNSPLFDNNIKAMAFNEESGEMYIASNKGVQSYRTPTTGSRVSHSSNVYAFPNPVRPEYNGTIAIKGLARDAEVKITDVDGQLVFQTEALGGQAIWDGRDRNGREVSGGVYLVFSSSSDSFRDPDSFVTKIMVVR